MNDKTFNEEAKRLEGVIKLINTKLEQAQKSFKAQENHIIGFKEGQRGTQFTRQALMSLYATETYELKRLLNNPYFGKIEFKDKLGNILPIYIGKKSLTDLNREIIIYDWRSPISSMYYDFSIGPAHYLEKEKEVSGEILRKRQLVIENSKLIKVEEQDAMTDDKMLMYYLNESADSRLKSIVATIQKEQNHIIRNPLKKNYIVQGVAGSGKTTVALHRIAYLIYNEAKNIKESQFMIIGPNKYFLNYISELLPDLDICSVEQNTFEQIAINNIGSKIKLESQNITLEKVLLKNIDPTIIQYKSSVNYLKLIEDALYFYITLHLNKPIIIDGVEICNVNELSLDLKNNSSVSYGTLIKEKISWLSKRIKNKSENLNHEIWQQYREEFLGLPENDHRRKEIIEYITQIQAEIKKGCPKILKDYYKFVKVNPITFYTAFIENLDKELIGCTEAECLLLKEYTLSNLKKKIITRDDLAPLLLIKHLLNGILDYQDYQHLVIDEAQDLSEAEYYVLKKLFPNCTFDIFGDLNQSIYAYHGVSDWKNLNQSLFDNEAEILELDKGYRTTFQICDSANYVLDAMSQKKSDCIARNGEEVKVKRTTKDTVYYELIKQIQQYTNKDYKTIAIICKDIKETKELYQKLSSLKLDIHMISEQDLTYNGGLCIMPSYLSKGLEFDAVILSNANEDQYNTNSIIDMKLLYVAMTRALHELQINYTNELTYALEELPREKTTTLKKTLKK